MNNVIIKNLKDKIYIISCFTDKIKLNKIENLSKIVFIDSFEDQYRNENGKISFLIGLKEKTYLIFFEKTICSYVNIFSKIHNSIDKSLGHLAATGAIKIDEKYVALKICDLKNIKKNKIYFINTLKQNLCEAEISGYSFLFSKYGLSVINHPNFSFKYKVLLCSCKKYYQGQKNGILLINIGNLEIEKNIYTYFYDSKDFEIYCFCPILKISAENVVESEFKYIETNYFFAGGFDNLKGQSCIKLFKVIYDENNYENKIEFVQDIDDYKNFKSPISCIIQEKLSPEKKLIVTCLDGNIYLFSGPNIDYYLKLDEEIKDGVSYEDFFKKNKLI